MTKDNLIAALKPLTSRARTDVTAIKAREHGWQDVASADDLAALGL